MKRSSNVILLMLGTGVGIAALSDEKSTAQLMQDSYASKEECVQDWGADQRCKDEQKNNGAHSSGGGGGGGGGRSTESNRYNGPRYYWDRNTGHPVVVSDSGAHEMVASAHPGGDPLSHSTASFHAGSVTRGGFGHFSGFGRGG